MAKRKHKHYEDYEVAIIREEISKHPLNLSHAFEEAHKRMPSRSAGAIANYYGRKIKPGEAVFAVATSQGAFINSKQVARPSLGREYEDMAYDIAMLALSKITSKDKILSLVNALINRPR